MKIEHLALWAEDLEKLKHFIYSTLAKYENKKKGYQVLNGPRRTGDGYYESCVLDPENNRLEITV